MFIVKYKNSINLKVLAVNKNGDVTEFLVYMGNKFEWIKSKDCILVSA